MSHFRLWQHCILKGCPVGITEHDARFISPISLWQPFRHVLNIQLSEWSDPKWRYHKQVSLEMRDGEVNHTPSTSGVVSSAFKCLPGSGGYIVTPEGARLLVEAARQEEDLVPLDFFVNKQKVELCDLIPFPIVRDPNAVSTVKPRADWRDYRDPAQGNQDYG